MIFFIGCDDPENVEINFGSIHKAQSITLDPFSMSSENWAENVKNFFDYDILIKSWDIDDIYIAIYRNNNWLDICHVINKPFGKEGKFLHIDITDKQGNFINDDDLLKIEIEKDPSLGRKAVFYNNKIALNTSRFPIQKEFIGKKVHVFAETIPIKIQISKKSNVDINSINRTHLINEDIILH